MAKDPAFLFYSQDWLVGTMTLTFEERGKYMTILSQMHQQGRMSEETIRFLVGSVSDNLRLKFKVDNEGFWYNERLEIESEKRKIYTESRRENGKKGGRPRKKSRKKPNQNHKDNHMANHMGNENENENENRIEYPWQTENFITAWNGWRKYKKEQFNFKYKSTSTEQAALTELNKLANSDTQAIAIIHQSIANGWKGFFELKNNGEIKKGFVKKAGAYLAANDPDWKNY